MTRRLRTVTKIFKNMYLSERTAIQFHFQSHFQSRTAPRYIYFAFPSCVHDMPWLCCATDCYPFLLSSLSRVSRPSPHLIFAVTLFLSEFGDSGGTIPMSKNRIEFVRLDVRNRPVHRYQELSIPKNGTAAKGLANGRAQHRTMHIHDSFF